MEILAISLALNVIFGLELLWEQYKKHKYNKIKIIL